MSGRGTTYLVTVAIGVAWVLYALATVATRTIDPLASLPPLAWGGAHLVAARKARSGSRWALGLPLVGILPGWLSYIVLGSLVVGGLVMLVGSVRALFRPGSGIEAPGGAG